jgi:hypothetical protein
MTRYACPVCHDPSAYPCWVGNEPPAACPYDEAWHNGGEPTIKNVTECAQQMAKAKQAAYFRKIAPEAFDENGKIKPDGWGILGPRLPKDYKLII